MLVQDYLMTRSLMDLDREHGVNARLSVRDPAVFTLNYDQIRVKDTDPLACECRGGDWPDATVDFLLERTGTW